MSDFDKDLSERYRAAARDEPPEHLDAAILAAAKRAVGSKPLPAGAPRPLQRWAVPVSLAAVIVLSVTVTLRVQEERPEIAMPDSAPVVLEKKQEPVPPAAAPAPRTDELARRPAAAADTGRAADAVPFAREKKPEPAQPASAPPAAPPAVVPAPKTASAQREAPTEDALRATELMRERRQEFAQPAPELQAAPSAAVPFPQRPAPAMNPAAGAATGSIAGNVAPAAKLSQRADLAKRELAPEEWLERIADLRSQNRNAEADEQLAEFKRRYPDYKIPEAMIERIAPRK